MLVALALGITPLHFSWLSSCCCADGSVGVISETFALPLDAIIPVEYARASIARARPVCVTPLPTELRVFSGRRLGYYAKGASGARYLSCSIHVCFLFTLVCSIATVLSFAGAVVISIDSSTSAHAQGCEYIIVESKHEAMTLGEKHVPFDWVIAVLCIGYVQPLSSSLVSTSQAQTPLPLRSSRFAVKRIDTSETVAVKETLSSTKCPRSTDFYLAHGARGGSKCRSNEAHLTHGSSKQASPNTSFTRSPASPSEMALSSLSSKMHQNANSKRAFSPQDAQKESSKSASLANATALIPPCFTLFDHKTKAYLRFDENNSVTSKVYSKDPSSNCELHAVECDQHGPYPHRLQCVHKSFLCVGRDGSVSLAGKGAGGRNLFKIAQSGSTRKCTIYDIIHESGRFLSLNASGAVCTKDSAVEATKWQLQPFDRNKKGRFN